MRNDNRGKDIFYGVVAIATLIVAIIGATLAYFSLIASQKEEGTVLYTGKLEINYIDGVYIKNPELWNQIMNVTPLKRWATVEEIARWAYFLTVENTFCTGQNILVDGGESINYHFVWKDE